MKRYSKASTDGTSIWDLEGGRRSVQRLALPKKATRQAATRDQRLVVRAETQDGDGAPLAVGASSVNAPLNVVCVAGGGVLTSTQRAPAEPPQRAYPRPEPEGGEAPLPVFSGFACVRCSRLPQRPGAVGSTRPGTGQATRD